MRYHKKSQLQSPDPYETKALKALLLKLYRMGLYDGINNLCNISIEGGFEYGVSKRPYESWGLVFVIRTFEIRDARTNDLLLPETENKADTLDEAISLTVKEVNKMLASAKIQEAKQKILAKDS